MIQARDYLYLIILLYFALDVVVKKSKKIKNNNFTVQKVNSTILLSWPVAIEAATVVAMAVVVKNSKKNFKNNFIVQNSKQYNFIILGGSESGEK